MNAGASCSTAGMAACNRSDVFAPDGGHLGRTAATAGFPEVESGDAQRCSRSMACAPGSRSLRQRIPLPVRAQCEAARAPAGASCTDAETGAPACWSVAARWKNRCFVAHAVTTGAAWAGAGQQYRRAALLAPMDVGLPDDGITQTRGDEVWAIAGLDVSALDASRAHARSPTTTGSVLRARLET
jgi:hypothetical protein